MMELFEARLNPTDEAMSSERIADTCDGAQVLVPTVTDRMADRRRVKLPETVTLIANFGVGVSSIDEAATARKIVVTNTPGV